ncbi:hypothetical protein B0T24DRAFT_596679 [Lasiosphaeria ovina]|uniref:Glucose-methanol-choline oxidoreductase N-terminal domain-containing protein n=1 Tax=Lasiosphaeria ovina TaxID=92902 RepID=A0AAE0N1L2_9PEZI|nr:hypothetical protein B0T24DRAFT_596679 [Lasiosphaeria ovina]
MCGTIPGRRFSRDVTVRGARKLVVVSAGAIASPLILERSGIGKRDILERAGVPLVAELPVVGHDYQDHIMSTTLYSTALEPNVTVDVFASGRQSVEEAIANKHPMLGWNGVDYVTICNILPYPYYRGHVHITGPELADPLDFDVGFYTKENDSDLKVQWWAYKKLRELMRRTYFFRAEAATMPRDQKEMQPSSWCHRGITSAPLSVAGFKSVRLPVAYSDHFIGDKLRCKSSLVAFEPINEPPGNNAADGTNLMKLNDLFL